MKSKPILAACFIVFAVSFCSVAQGQWQLVYTDNWGNPLDFSEEHTAIDKPFRVYVMLHNTGTSDLNFYNFQLNFEYDTELSYVDNSFELDSWEWGGSGLMVQNDQASGTLTVTSDDTSGWPHTAQADARLWLGSFEMTAESLNFKDYVSGERTPWQLNFTGGEVYTDGPAEEASGTPILFEVYTDGQRDLIEPDEPFDTADFYRVGVSYGSYAFVENFQYLDPNIIETDLEERWFDSSQAYRTSSVSGGGQIKGYAWEYLENKDRNWIFSMQADAEIDDLLMDPSNAPSDRFTCHARAEIPSGCRLVTLSQGEYGTGTPLRVDVAAAMTELVTQAQYPHQPSGTVDWQCTVRLNAADGVVLGTFDENNPSGRLAAQVGDSLYFSGYLDAQAETGEWSYLPELGLYSAQGGHAKSSVDFWVHMNIAIEGDVAGGHGVDMVDFAVFALSWKSVAGGLNWNSDCNLDDTGASAGLIDEADLSLFCQNWLKGI